MLNKILGKVISAVYPLTADIRLWTEPAEASVCQAWLMLTLPCKTQSSQRSYHSVSRPKLQLHVNHRHPTSALCSSRPPSRSHACSPDDVSDTHEWPIDAKRCHAEDSSYQEHEAERQGWPDPQALWIRTPLQSQLGLAQIWSRGRRLDGA